MSKKIRFLFLVAAGSLAALSFSASSVRLNKTTQWDVETVKKANTAKDITYLTAEEKKLILFINLARLKPQLFADTYLKKYLDSTKTPASSWVNSLRADLKKTQALPVLNPQKDLYDVAKEFAVYMGKKGGVGHENYEKRTKVIHTKYKWIAENCDYGSGTALGIVMNLLIDEGIEGAGHRKNLLDPRYENVGLSIQPHKDAGYNCVIEMAAKAK